MMTTCCGSRARSQQVIVTMSDLATLEQTILDQIAAATEEAARQDGGSGPDPPGQAGDRRTDGDLSRNGTYDRRRSRHRERRLQLHHTELPGRPAGAGDAQHLLIQAEAGRLAHAAADPHFD